MSKELMGTLLNLINLALVMGCLYLVIALIKQRSLNKYYEAVLKANNIEFKLNKKTNGQEASKDKFSLIVTTMFDSYEVVGKKDMENFLVWYQGNENLDFVLLPMKDGCFIIHRKDIIEVRCYGKTSSESPPWITAITRLHH